MLQTVCTITLQRGGGFTHFLSSGFIKAIVMNRPDGKQRNTPLLALHCVDGHVALKVPDDKYFLWHEKSETTSIFSFVFVWTHMFRKVPRNECTFTLKKSLRFTTSIGLSKIWVKLL